MSPDAAGADAATRDASGADAAGPDVGPGPAVGDLLELDVTGVAHGGSCVARHDGQAVFVRHTLPGERVQARVTEVRRTYLRADAVEVLLASPDRVERPCRYAGPGGCGGCDWQHVTPAAQRRLKTTVVLEQLARLAGLDLAGTTLARDGAPFAVVAVPGDDDGLGWRTRVAFTVRRDGVVGLRRHRSHAVQPVRECLIAHPLVTAVGVAQARWPAAGGVEVEVSPSSGERLVVVTPAGRRPVVMPELDEGVGVALRRGARVTPVEEPSVLREQVGDLAMTVRAGGFWQVHPGAAEALTAAVGSLLAPRPGERVLDLYAGAGLFAAALATAVGPAGSVLAVESDRGAVADARTNLAPFGWARAEQAEVTVDLAALGEPVDLVVLDPPRAGAGQELTARLAALPARAIAYVACDPAALARDTAVLRAHGWELTALRGFDLFPMTAHVECVALFERAG